MNWEKTTIGEHCTVTSSKRFHLSERSTSGVPFYCSKEIIQKVNGHEIIECDYIREELYEQVKKQFGVPKTGDLLAKIDELEKISKENISRKSKWEKVKPIIAFALDKGADVAIAILSLILQMKLGA